MRRDVNAPAGTIHRLKCESSVLADNPLGDSPHREIDVYVPAGHSGNNLPLLVDLVGFTAGGPAHTNWRNFTENVPEQADRLIASGEMPPAVIAFPDCFTRLGGNQYINSSGVGRWADFLLSEAVPFVEDKFGCGGAGKRGVFGKSSGGYGAMVHALLYSHFWSAAACHSGDMGFELMYLAEMATVLRAIAKEENSIRKWLESFYAKRKVKDEDVHVLMMFAQCATFDPAPDEFMNVRLPVDTETCEIIPERWANWMKWDPLTLAEAHSEGLKRLKVLFIDCGTIDQYNLLYGARRMHRLLDHLGAPHIYEEFPDNHSGIDYRMDRSLPLLAKGANMIADIARAFAQQAPVCDEWSISLVHRRSEHLSVTRGVSDPIRRGDDAGAMIAVTRHSGGAPGTGYAATSDVTSGGLKRAAQEALAWAERSAGHLIAAPNLRRNGVSYEHIATPDRPWNSVATAAKLTRLHEAAGALKRHDCIIHWQASLSYSDEETVFASSAGDFIREGRGIVVPGLEASASANGETQTRSLGRGGQIRQGALEQLDDIGFWEAGPRIGEEAVELLAAPNCPNQTMDLLLAPDQMYIQIHESIGHPLELDRILGDERNYAGTSFVTPDMFGAYRYGSEILNVTFDPDVRAEAANYAYDDHGDRAERCHLIRNGVLERALGGSFSQSRANIPGVANARACNWNRAAIDRMANLNVEPGASTFDELLAQVENGIYMETNSSWSIDDSRNKFQFGCERGRLIQNGQLGPVVKNPNYRGISAVFWRSLKALGNAATVQALGTPTCGKGEPNQAIRVGHATPPGLFAAVQVFGGE